MCNPVIEFSVYSHKQSTIVILITVICNTITQAIARLRRRGEEMTNLKIPIENAVLMVTGVESRDGTVGFEVEVSAHVLRSIGGTRVSIYIHDKRGLQTSS